MAQTRLFVSYSRKDSGFAHRLAKDLAAAGYDAWVDVSGLRGGQKWARGIDTAVRDCDVFLVVVSPEAMASEWVGKETLLAQNLRKLILPVMCRETPLPVHLVDTQWVDFRVEYDAALPALLEALPPPGAGSPPPPPVQAASPVPKTEKRLFRLPAWAWGVAALVVVAAGIGGGFAAGLWTFPSPAKESPVTPEGSAGRGFVVDNADPGFLTVAGDWGICTDGDCEGVCYGEEFRWARPGCRACQARFDFTVPTAGEHDLWTWWPRGEDRATDTPFIILQGGEPITVTVDQRHEGNAWYRLGAFTFEQGESASIIVAGSDSGYANADAIAVTPVGAGPPTPDVR